VLESLSIPFFSQHMHAWGFKWQETQTGTINRTISSGVEANIVIVIFKPKLTECVKLFTKKKWYVELFNHFFRHKVIIESFKMIVHPKMISSFNHPQVVQLNTKEDILKNIRILVLFKEVWGIWKKRSNCWCFSKASVLSVSICSPLSLFYCILIAW